MTTTTHQFRGPHVTREDKAVIIWAVGSSIVFLTAVMAVAAKPAAVIARVDAAAASGVIAFLLLAYSLTLVIGCAWHHGRRTAVRTHRRHAGRPMPRRPRLPAAVPDDEQWFRTAAGPSAVTLPAHDSRTIVDLAEPWTPPVAPNAVERPPSPDTRIHDDELLAPWQHAAGRQ